MIHEPIIIEQTYNAPIEQVWKAITDKEEMKQWYFDLKNFSPEVGVEFQFTGGTEERSYLHLCEVIAVKEQSKLKHSWRYDGYEGNSFISWELSKEGNKTRLKLTHDGLETFPASNPDFAKNNFVMGWNEITGKNLREYLEKVK